MQQTITETATTLQATPIADKPGELLVTLITPGQGSSGFYSAECLEAAGTDKVFPAGTQMFLDHPTESEQYERPERSVKDLGAVLTEDATWNGTALVVPAKPFSQHKELLSEMQEFIGDLSESGVVLSTEGLQPSARGARVSRVNGRVSAVDGPFAETKELVAGYVMVRVASKREAIELAGRFLEVAGEGTAEVREVIDSPYALEEAGVAAIGLPRP